MVEQLKQYKVLLAVVALLATIKFAIVPLVTWQGEQVEHISQIQKRQIKASQIMMQLQDIEVAKQQVADVERVFKTMLFDWQAPSKFRIDTQKKLNQLLTEHKLSTVNIGWQPALKYQSAGLHKEQVRLNISGKLADFAAFLVMLEAQSPVVLVEYVDLNIRGLNAKETGNAEVSLLLSFYLQEGEQDA
ncbi:hypothetical protein EAG18_03940 [Pseudoalteromonas sp. J010]|uniref:GspMb/PilO family protein n=1 Tax=Pseudoalteromonas sp. J010 TaxID=998465 RepID=UPI000F655BBA|nr:GspMb/PilO family protein [Pseudoalteromonas sp. J010]RRS10090.1 hypothetical protein EAG18_03940 [Pseudoalteromonas sp. J010]